MKKQLLIAAGLAAMLATTTAWAGNGRGCLQLIPANNTSGRALENFCSHAVEATWCYGYGCSYNNSWTIQPHQQMPLESANSTSSYVDFDGCDGANSIKSTQGNRVQCR